METSQTITIAILAGGKSRRMQQDKALLPFDGGTLLERTVLTASGAGLPIIIVGRRKPEDWAEPSVNFVPDELPESGPLGGLLTAFNATDDHILALAADMPLLTLDVLALLLTEEVHHPDNDGIIFLKEDEPEPLCALYRRSTIPIIQKRLELGKCSMKGVIDDGHFLFIPLPDILSEALTNVNTPEELQRIIS